MLSNENKRVKENSDKEFTYFCRIFRYKIPLNENRVIHANTTEFNLFLLLKKNQKEERFSSCNAPKFIANIFGMEFCVFIRNALSAELSTDRAEERRPDRDAQKMKSTAFEIQ